MHPCGQLGTSDYPSIHSAALDVLPEALDFPLKGLYCSGNENMF